MTSDQSKWPPFGSITQMTAAERAEWNKACDDQINMLLREAGYPLPTFDGHEGTYSDVKCCNCPWWHP